MNPALVIGGGPAGLMAAEALSDAGWPVLVAEAKPSLARKFLMAGKSGLNLTKDEPRPALSRAYAEAAAHLDPMLRAFDADAVQQWARDLGQPVFTGSSGRVFPEAMKASPLLRAWLARLSANGVDARTRWRWTGWDEDLACFDTPDGPQQINAPVTVLALGGASWSRLGSDGAWAPPLRDEGVAVAPFQPANAGLTVAWSDHMTPHFGRALKGLALIAGDQRIRAEAIVSQRGLEGGGIYAISRAVREGADLALDLAPDLTQQQVFQRLSKPRGKATLKAHLRRTLRLEGVRYAVLMEFARPLPGDPSALAAVIKACPVRHMGLRPLDEAISTAGGVTWAALDDDLMLKARPGVFCAGEMIDWEAPTGGYLLTACFATGLWAGRAAARYAGQNR